MVPESEAVIVGLVAPSLSPMAISRPMAGLRLLESAEVLAVLADPYQ